VESELRRNAGHYSYKRLCWNVAKYGHSEYLLLDCVSQRTFLNDFRISFAVELIALIRLAQSHSFLTDGRVHGIIWTKTSSVCQCVRVHYTIVMVVTWHSCMRSVRCPVIPRLHDQANIRQPSSKCIQNARARRVL